MTMTSRMPDAAAVSSAGLHRLLDDSLRLPPEYGPALSSHLPMALAALAGLGAGEDRLRAFFEVYARRFARGTHAMPATSAPLTTPAGTAQDAPGAGAAANWTTLRGRFDAFDALRTAFAAALAAEGRDAVLHAALPWLICGIGGAAFHGAIRTAHAVESRHEAELAAALAYWAVRWSPLPEPMPGGAPFDDAAAWLRALDARLLEADASWRPAAPLISERMLEAARTSAWLELGGRYGTTAGDPAALLRSLALAAAARYAATRNFTVLHMATAARAARVLLPWLPAGAAALTPLWHAVAAASLASGARWGGEAGADPGAPLPVVDGPELGWAEVRTLACASDDDHVIKLVHAMATQHEGEPHPVWLAAARVAVVAPG